ncbi:hypothetical protein GO986_06745 [Deinococcus sp. HMF7620]|uniref:Uncharacterized protein n=1 Tax=Deinococcus arboris TaxID=2682977 RepID=A0A7C9LT89_9DEIO|nr:hypothetical protein [Deinococcus arboris]MVN86460.1 hypothetical protein [Deinococcus arboris]
MLSIPVLAEIEGVTVFRDDENPANFYYLPSKPVIAPGANGKPQFTFMRYQFAIERPGAEPGGGYLVFTTVMRESPQTLAKIRQALQSRLRSEMPTTTVLPEVTLAPVDFTEGEVRLIIMQNDKFIKAVNLGKPSLFGDNIASLAVELTADGATLFYEALRKQGSVAAIEYDLTFPVRLPAITIRGHVDSKEVKEAVIGYTKEQVSSSDTWGNDESHEVAHRTSIAETMESQGLIQLEILKGTAELGQDDMESLRAFAFQAMDAFIKEHFLKGGTIETDKDRESQWMSYLQQDIQARFDLNVSYRDVIKRQYNPSAQINPSFLGVPVDDVLIEIDLGNAPWFFNTLTVDVDTNFDFTRYGDFVHSVVGHFSYDQVRPDGTRITKRDSLAFTATDNKPKKFESRIAAVGKDTYHVEVDVNYKSGPVLKSTLEGRDTTLRHCTLSVPNPGIIEINLSTAPGAFNDKLTGIEVEIEYADSHQNVPHAVETVLLDDKTPAATYKRVIYAPWTQPYRSRVTYVLKDDAGNMQRTAGDWLEHAPGAQNLAIHTPFEDSFNLNVIPLADWEEVRQLLVDLDYEDPANGYRMQTTLSFSRDQAGMLPWRFMLRDKTRRGYRFRQTTLLHNGASEDSGWVTQESDGSLKVGNAPHGLCRVEVDPGDLDWGSSVKRALVRLSYHDPALPAADEAALMFRDAAPQTWTVTLGPAVREYSYDVTYFLKDGTQRPLTGQHAPLGATQEFLILPEPPSA